METEINVMERIRKVIEESNLSDRQFCMKANIKPSTLNSEFKRGQDDTKLSIIVSILNAFSDISIDWLVMGKGGMKKDEGSSIEEAKSRISELERERALQYEHIEMLKHRIAELEGAGASEKKKAV